MSRVAQDWVSSSGLVGNKRFILRELAECHNQTTGRCDPAIKKDRSEPTGRSLNELTGIGEAKLSKLLDELEAEGRLIRERRHWKKNGWRASDQFHLAIEGIEKLREDIVAGTVWTDDRMTGPKAWTVTPRDTKPKASDRTGPKREFGAPLSVTRAGAYQEGRTGKEETTTASTVNGSSYVADKDLSTSTTDGAGAVEEKPSDNNGSQGTNHDQDLQPLVAESEPSKPEDEAELNGGNKEVGARTLQDDLPIEVRDVLAAFPGFDRNDLAAKWRRRLNEDVSDEAMSALRLYCKLCVGTASSHRLKTHEAAARALPPRQGGDGRFSRPLEAVA